MKKRVGLILSGCGNLDGSEIRETLFAALALDQSGAEVIFLAPKIPQYHTMNYLTRHPTSETRDVFEEAARIARGQIHDTADYNAKNLDAVILPGGMGAAKNLSTFAFNGAKAKVEESVAKLLVQMHKDNKPIGAICIAPNILALLFGPEHPELTLGQTSETSQEIEKLGVKHIPCDAREVVIDRKHKFVTTPAYMIDGAGMSDLYTGISLLVKNVLELV